MFCKSFIWISFLAFAASGCSQQSVRDRMNDYCFNQSLHAGNFNQHPVVGPDGAVDNGVNNGRDDRMGSIAPLSDCYVGIDETDDLN